MDCHLLLQGCGCCYINYSGHEKCITHKTIILSFSASIMLSFNAEKVCLQQLFPKDCRLHSCQTGEWWLKPPMCLATQSCPTPCGPMDCSPTGSSVHGIFQSRILEWVTISPSCVSCLSRQNLYHQSPEKSPIDLLIFPVFFFHQLLSAIKPPIELCFSVHICHFLFHKSWADCVTCSWIYNC